MTSSGSLINLWSYFIRGNMYNKLVPLMFQLMLCIIIMVMCNVTDGTPTAVSNHKILRNLGMQKVNLSPNYYKKRLAEESRHHGNNGDSNIFIVKLPPNPYYYVHNNGLGDDDVRYIRYRNQAAVQFQTNGKPTKIYHWNVPILKQLMKESKSRKKFYNKSNVSGNLKKYSGTKSAVMTSKKSFYVPARKNKSVFYRFAHGNGKPHSFYILNDSGHKFNYQKLIKD